MPKIVDISTSWSRIDFMCSLVEHEISFITSGKDFFLRVINVELRVHVFLYSRHSRKTD